MLSFLTVFSTSAKRKTYEEEIGTSHQEALTAIFGECTEVINDHDNLNLTILTAKPGKSFCIYNEDFVVKSEQKFSVDIRKVTDGKVSTEKNTVMNPFIVNPNGISHKNIKCEDSVECKIQFAFIVGKSFFPNAVSSTFVTINSDFEYSGTVNQEISEEEAKEADKEGTFGHHDSYIFNYISNQGYDIELKKESGDLFVYFTDMNGDTDARNFAKNDTYKWQFTHGFFVISCQPYNQAGKRSAKFSISFKLNASETKSDDKPFGGLEVKGKVTKEVSSPEDVRQTETTPTKSPDSSKLSPGAIVGIVIAALVVVAIICVLIWFFVFHKKPADDGSGPGEDA